VPVRLIISYSLVEVVEEAVTLARSGRVLAVAVQAVCSLGQCLFLVRLIPLSSVAEVQRLLGLAKVGTARTAQG
jgi:hypothetical protein